MPTPTKTRKSKPPTGGQSSRGFPRPRGNTQPPRRRPQFARKSTKPAAKRPSGLIGRAQATLPGRKPPAKTSAIEGVMSALGSAKSRAVAHQPSKKGIVGILAGGLGVAAIGKRRAGKQEEAAMTPPVQPGEASGGAGDPRPADHAEAQR